MIFLASHQVFDILLLELEPVCTAEQEFVQKFFDFTLEEPEVSLSRKWEFVFDLRLHVTLNFMYLSYSTLLSNSLLRTDTIIFAKLNKPPPPRPLSTKPISNVLEVNKHPGVLNRGFTVQLNKLSPSNVPSYLHM